MVSGIFTIHLYIRTFNSNRNHQIFPFYFIVLMCICISFLPEQWNHCATLTLLFLSDFLFAHILQILCGTQGFPTGSLSTHRESHWTPTGMNLPTFCGQTTSWRSYANRMVRNDAHLFLCSYAWSVIPSDKTQAQRFGEHVEIRENGLARESMELWACPVQLFHLAIPELDPYSAVINR